MLYMVKPVNSRDKKEHFNFMSTIENIGAKIVDNVMWIAIVIGIIIIAVAAYFFIHHNKTQGGAGIMDYMTDVSPMAPLTATPQM